MDQLTVLIMSLLSFKGIGNQSVLGYLNESKQHLKNFDFAELSTTKVSKIRKLLDEEIISNKTWQTANEVTLKRLQISLQENIQIINCFEDSYPKRLQNMANRPVLLYLKGNLRLLNEDKILAIVGTRTPRKSSQTWVFNITNELANNYVIVSGLAKGIDTVVQRQVVDCHKQTIAVLGSGLDMPIYPFENEDLAAEILNNNGLLVSTYPNGTKVYSHNLAARDEWQSALSDGVIVAETGMRGGTTNTINFAFQQEKLLMMYDDLELSGNQFFLNDTRIKPIKDCSDIFKQEKNHIEEIRRG
ncbi:DNA-processing protein DprA [Companilactobacillus kedongensis]|uniref:DNA-processing protein DprA n=1 Tax=Companilactobacillus kedongensis TaxID=2486004 RepID=UPI0013DE57E9|nr:DNA-processing protein DprA [Companilactobacillus kedongensis]